MGSIGNEINKLIGLTNFLAWKKRIDLALTEHEVMEYVLGEFIEPRKYKTQQLEKDNKGELGAQRIILESIKDRLTPFVSNLKTSKAMYDKLVNLYSIITLGQKMYLRNKLYKIKESKNEDMDSFLMKIYQIRDQLWGLKETIYDSKMTI